MIILIIIYKNSFYKRNPQEAITSIFNLFCSSHLTQIQEHSYTEACFNPSDRGVAVCHDKHTHPLITLVMVVFQFLSLRNKERWHHEHRLFPQTHSTQQRRSLRPTNILPRACDSHATLPLLTAAAAATADLTF